MFDGYYVSDDIIKTYQNRSLMTPVSYSVS